MLKKCSSARASLDPTAPPHIAPLALDIELYNDTRVRYDTNKQKEKQFDAIFDIGYVEAFRSIKSIYVKNMKKTGMQGDEGKTTFDTIHRNFYFDKSEF